MTSVRWLNLHPKEVNFEKHWDIEIVRFLLDSKPWSYDYAESTQLHRQGAIIVLPGRFHDNDLERINEIIRYEPWVVYVITSDEESAFDVDRLEHPNRKVWVQTPKPGKHDPYGWLPVGWTPHTSLADGQIKTLDWYFAGQVTHSRRLELAAVLRGLAEGVLIATEGFTQGLPPAQYIQGLASAKVAPCPAGPITPDTFRLCEALELGCIPIVETQTPDGFWPDYWPGVFGDHPIPVVESWYELPDLLNDLLADWPRKINEVGAWWIGWKRDLHRRFWADVKAVAG